MRGQRRPAKSSAISGSTLPWPNRSPNRSQRSKSKASKSKPPGPRDGADVLARIADALERLAPQRTSAPDFAGADAFVWHPDGRRLAPVKRVNRVEMSLLKGIDRVRDVLVENTERFAKGLPANNALLWGARGMGKSSLVKAAHAGVNATLARQGKSAPAQAHRDPPRGHREPARPDGD